MNLIACGAIAALAPVALLTWCYLRKHPTPAPESYPQGLDARSIW